MESKRRNAIITFDYEVFLGRKTGTIENCVLKPARAVLKILKENNAKAIFFVDTTWLLFLRDNFHDDFQVVKEQLKDIIASGSSVELHLHPQWLTASIENGEVVFDSYENYTLHSLKEEEIPALFVRSAELLQSITGQKVRCFRAGGWCVEPFDKLKDAFLKVGVQYDFSVVPGVYLKEGKSYDFDFTRAPGLMFYKFSDCTVEPDKNGVFTEFPVSTYKNNPLYRVLNKVLIKLRGDHIFGDGISNKEKSAGQTLSNLFRFSKGMLTLDRMSNAMFKFLLLTHFRRSRFLVVVSHPKTESKEALRNLTDIVKRYNTLESSELGNIVIN